MRKTEKRFAGRIPRQPGVASAFTAAALVFIGSQDLAAQTTVTTPPVVVTATRIDEGLPAASTTIIDAQDLADSPLSTLPEILDVEAGVQSRDLFGGTAGSRASVDMRGFGAPSKSNTLILLNGRRLNDIDLSAIDYANIPRESIERIEILRGSAGGVLYGDGAIGGTINIITKPAITYAPQSTADVSVGSDEYREVNLSTIQKIGSLAANAYGTYINGDGYRDNNKIIQRNLVTELRHVGDSGDIFVNLNLDSQRLGLPGGRLVTPTSNLAETDPRGAARPLDYAFQNGIFVTTGLTREVGESTELIVDASVRRKDQDASFFVDSGFPSSVDTELTTWSLTPRTKIDHGIGGKVANSTAGIDFYYSDYNSNRKAEPGDAPQHRYDAEQYSTALYGQTSVHLSDKVASVIGARVQRVDFTVGDIFDSTAPSAFGSAKDSLSDNEFNYAFNMGLEWQVKKELAVFARAGRNFRFPTLDERVSTEDSASFRLSTQTAKEVEVGTKFRISEINVQSSVFYMRTRNEIRFNPTLGGGFGTNSNFDPIKRYGWENSFRTKLHDDLSLKFNFTLMQAKFTEGAFDGKDVPLVSEVTAATALGWRINKDIQLDTLVSYAGERWLENDEANTFSKTPNHVLVGLKLKGDLGPVFWSAAVNNLFDEDYFNYGVASTTTAGRYNAYPQPGRTFMLRLGAKL